MTKKAGKTSKVQAPNPTPKPPRWTKGGEFADSLMFDGVPILLLQEGTQLNADRLPHLLAVLNVNNVLVPLPGRVPWRDGEEYDELHDEVQGNLDFAGATPNVCPYGAKGDCSSLVVVNNLALQDCPRFGGCKGDLKHGGLVKILCRGKRYFAATGNPEPTKVGASRPKAKE